jgi:hypothetical protein
MVMLTLVALAVVSEPGGVPDAVCTSAFRAEAVRLTPPVPADALIRPLGVSVALVVEISPVSLRNVVPPPNNPGTCKLAPYARPV